MMNSVSYLRSPKAIREQCGKIFARGEAGGLAHFALDLGELPKTASYVLAVIREAYPKLDVPYHSRWRHFEDSGMARLATMLKGRSAADVARAKFELAIVSVLLDAGAGMGWRYRDAASGKVFSKSEGLAVASFEMFLAGAFSGDPRDPLRADAKGLKGVTKEALAKGFQVTSENPLEGFDGRLSLLHRLGEALDRGRIGSLYDKIAAKASGGRLPAREILAALLEGLGTIWPGRVEVEGVNLGDVWRHSALPETAPGLGLVPFHKLSQWLAYSLVEPLEESGLTVHAMDELTGLPEYRNGGLLVDLGVLKPKRADILTTPHRPDSEVIVEWRALTVILLDKIAAAIRKELKLTAEQLPLAKVLQGGTWSAGRKAAAARRADGGPPLKIISDGTVF